MNHTGWTKAPCASSSCIEAQIVGAYVEVRDSNFPLRSIWVPAGEWAHGLDSINAGRLPAFVEVDGDQVTFTGKMVFTGDEWAEFKAAVKDGTFNLTLAPEPADVA